MELMKLVAKLQLDDSGFNQGVNNAESLGEKFTGSLKSMTIAAGKIIADIAEKAVEKIKDMLTGAIDAFADYQQLIGGIETLFKTSTGKMEEYAKNSFKNTGLSANQYMETAMSFSASLLQGVKGNTEMAADYTNLAIQDMADNANKMGTDMKSIQNAYAGFAKRNYTMLDNLKLGYGGTEAEMIRLVNDSHILDHEITSLDEITFDQLILAIHTVQSEMGITGTTAQEAAETITGSAAAMKAAWEDLLSAVGGEGDQGRLDQTLENFKYAFGTYMENFLPALTSTIANSGTLVEVIAECIASLPSSLMANLTNAGLGAGADLLHGAEILVGWIIDSLANTVATLKADPSSVEKFGGALGHFLGSTVKNILTNFPSIVDGMISIGWELAGSILGGIWDGLFGSKADGRLQEIEDTLNQTIVDATVSASRANAILDEMLDLWEQHGEAAKETDEWIRAQERLEGVLEGSGEVFEAYGEDVEGAITHLRTMTEELRKLAIQQALQKRMEDEYAYLGELYANKDFAQVEIDESKRMQKDIREQMLASTRAYAMELLMDTREKDMGFLHFVNPFNTDEVGSEMAFSADRMRARQLLLNGEIFTSSGFKSIDEAAPEEIISAGSTFGNLLKKQNWGAGPENPVWDISESDNIFTPEQFEKLGGEYEKLGIKIEENTKIVEESDAAIIEATRAAKIAEEAYYRGAEELEGFSFAVDQASVVAGGFKSALSAIGGIDFSGLLQTANPWAPKAIGMDYVPYDGFRAELHRGEAILTKEQNAARSSGYGYDMEYALENAVRAGMSGMYLNMDGSKVADMTTRRTGKNISANEHAKVRAMGG